MALEYFSFYAEQREFIKELNNEERGDLFSGILRYAFDGETPEFSTNARYVFPFFKLMIDKCQEKHDVQKANGSKGGRPPKQDKPNGENEKPKITQNNPNKPNKNPNDPKRHNKDIDTDIDSNYEEDIHRTLYPCLDQSDSTDSDLERIMREQSELFDAAEKAGFGKTEAERFKITDLYSRYGLEKCLSSIDACATYGKPSVAYMKAVLENNGAKKPGRPVNPFLDAAMRGGSDQ